VITIINYAGDSGIRDISLSGYINDGDVIWHRQELKTFSEIYLKKRQIDNIAAYFNGFCE